MWMLNIPHRPFPQVLSSPTGSLSRPSASITSMGRKKLQGKLLRARAHWSGMSGRMANPAPNTRYEPNFNFFRYMDTEHTPIHLPDNHHDFQYQDDATVIATTDPEGLPRSGASSSSKQTAAAEFPQYSDLQASGNRWQVMCRVVQVSRKLLRFRTENLLQRRFLVHSRKGREIET